MHLESRTTHVEIWLFGRRLIQIDLRGVSKFLLSHCALTCLLDCWCLISLETTEVETTVGDKDKETVKSNAETRH